MKGDDAPAYFVVGLLLGMNFILVLLILGIVKVV